MNNEAVSNQKFVGGFTKTPHHVLEWLFQAGLTKRECLVVLLVVRLTFGCHCEWAEIRKADLKIVDIGAGHANATIKSLLDKRVLVENKIPNQYRLSSNIRIDNETSINRLDTLLNKHIYRSGKSEVTKSVTPDLPIYEAESYQFGNGQGLPKKEPISVEPPFIEQPKDSAKIVSKENVKDTFTLGGLLDA